MQNKDEPTSPLMPIQPIRPRDALTLRQLLHRGQDRRVNSAIELTGALRLSYHTLLRCEENPAHLTMGDLFRLANFLNMPIEVLLSHLIREVRGLPANLSPLVKTVRTGVGRPRLARPEATPEKKKPIEKKEKKKREKKTEKKK